MMILSMQGKETHSCVIYKLINLFYKKYIDNHVKYYY